jgi:hypothetical protein
MAALSMRCYPAIERIFLDRTQSRHLTYYAASGRRINIWPFIYKITPPIVRWGDFNKQLSVRLI